MTQSPQSGQGAPVNTEFGPGSAARNDGGASSAGASPWSSPSPAPGGNGTPVFSSTPLSHADAPTASVPQIRDGEAPGGPAASAGRTNRGARNRGPRRARLQLRHINPFTVLKFSCVLAIALFFVWLIVVGILYGVLNGAGAIGKINETYTTIKGDGAKAPVTAGVVFGSAAIIGVVNIILFIALSTIGSVVYNLCADLVGGIEITLSER
jgi:hypothetical protein